MMNRVLGKDDEVFVYIDDILVATDSEQRHFEVLEEVLHSLRTANLKLKPQKYVLMEEEIAFLGHRESGEGIHVDPDKVDKMQQHPKPTNLAEMRTFLASAVTTKNLFGILLKLQGRCST